MSDARPITNITDYVCGNCWNSFSRTDPGVVQGDSIVCPHCGHEQDRDGGDLAALVRSAPSTRSDDSDAFDGFDVPWIAHTAAPDRTPTVLPEPVAIAAVPAPAVVDAGYVAGDDELDADVSEHTPFETRLEDLLAGATSSASVRAESAGSAVRVPQAPVAAGSDPAEEEDDLARQLEAAFADADGQATPVMVAVTAGQASQSTEAPLPPVATDQTDPVAADEVPVELVDRDWKLKAMGLTYNFHGLEALLTWAANKTGQAMALSINNGEDWKDFYSFYAALSSGRPAQSAYDEALAPAQAPAPQAIHVTARMARLSTQQLKAPPPDLLMPKSATAPLESSLPAAPAGPQAPSLAQHGPSASPSRSTPEPELSPSRTPSRTSAQPAVAPAASPARKPAMLVLGGVLVLVGVVLLLKILKVF